MIISRYHNTKQLDIGVEFLTPCFLGGADQNAELRAAPFKNLLRQWWRVAVGSQYSDPKEMLAAEGNLFGSVIDDSKASASRVRLDVQEAGVNIVSEKAPLDDLGKTFHSEVKGGMQVSNALYLGFGPVSNRAIKAYIAPGSKAKLTLTFPKDNTPELLLVLAYIDAFGAIGSRCRNGWGAIALSGEGLGRQAVNLFSSQKFAQLVSGDTAKDYPTHLGKDNKGLLCWELKQPSQDWKDAMQALAGIYMDLRTSINIAPNGLQKRHILGYPVTNHPVEAWGNKDGRMPSQLRLIVKRNEEEQLVARILHLPHKLPKQWESQRLGQEVTVWQQDIHKWLDHNTALRRCGGTQ